VIFTTKVILKQFVGVLLLNTHFCLQYCFQIFTRMAESTSHCYRLVVAAFDFGTTFSGYAFSFRDSPLDIKTNPSWVAGSEKLISLKTPTCVLLKPNKEFHSFGFEAENKYSDLAEDDEHHGWYMFRRFKMILYDTKVFFIAIVIIIAFYNMCSKIFY
jgi:hypothetical protein